MPLKKMKKTIGYSDDKLCKVKEGTLKTKACMLKKIILDTNSVKILNISQEHQVEIIYKAVK